MSFLAGRLAAAEGAYFLHESRNAVGRLAQKLPPPPSGSTDGVKALTDDAVGTADVLPEILRHSLPIKGAAVPEPSSLSTSSKWLVHSSSSSSAPVLSDSHNPLRAYISLPQATFGPKRYAPHLSFQFSPLLEQLQFLILFTFVPNFVEIDDIKTKGRDLIQPGADMLKERMGPFRIWVCELLLINFATNYRQRKCRENGIVKLMLKLKRRPSLKSSLELWDLEPLIDAFGYFAAFTRVFGNVLSDP
ncbi:hypothetical protein BHE74_00004388 [Ensete ventricosum]|nr:hypothetical protein BHE74_00004388 [Ensete ventricosum]